MFLAFMFLSSPAQWGTYVVIPDSSCVANVPLSCASSQLCKPTHPVFLCLAEKKQHVIRQDELWKTTLTWCTSTESSQATEELDVIHRPASAEVLQQEEYQKLHKTGTKNHHVCEMEETDSSAQQTKLKILNSRNAFWEYLPECKMSFTSIMYYFPPCFPSGFLLRQLQVKCMILSLLQHQSSSSNRISLIWFNSFTR